VSAEAVARMIQEAPEGSRMTGADSLSWKWGAEKAEERFGEAMSLLQALT
jgi:hypothetical protein